MNAVFFKKGQVLVEVIIALGIAVVAMVALVMVATRSVSSSGLARRQSQATGLANKVIEMVRLQKQTSGWDQFKATYSGSGCYNGTEILMGPECAISGTEYSSVVNFSYQNVTPPPSGPVVEKLIINVEVSWQEGERKAKVNQGQIFSRY